MSLKNLSNEDKWKHDYEELKDISTPEELDEFEREHKERYLHSVRFPEALHVDLRSENLLLPKVKNPNQDEIKMKRWQEYYNERMKMFGKKHNMNQGELDELKGKWRSRFNVTYYE